MPILIDEAKPADWPRLEQLYREVRVAAFTWLDAARLESARLAGDAEGELVYVARDADGEIAGFASVWAPENFIHHLYVDRARQGTGAGTALLKHVAERHPGLLRLKCMKKNLAARRFYERRGWRVVGTGESENGGYLLMEWDGRSAP